MQRQVTAHLRLDVIDPALLALQIGVATRPAVEDLTVLLDGRPVAWREIPAPHGGRMHVLDAAPGTLVVDYAATVQGEEPVPVGTEHDHLADLRPSRYCRRRWAPARAAMGRGRPRDGPWPR